MNWILAEDDRIVLQVRAVPRASKDEIKGVRGDVLRIGVRAAPEDGKANKALVLFLARLLDIRRKNVAILAGEKSRLKRVAITGVGLDDAVKSLTRDQ